MNSLLCEDIIRHALAEDVGFQDLTTEAIVQAEHRSVAEISCKEHGVLAGIEVAAQVFRLLDKQIKFIPLAQDGQKIHSGEIIAGIEGRTSSILTGERTALNLLQRLSGIATCTNTAQEMVREFNCQIIDTRKTTPGLRALEKYAVRVGGGRNHRFGLFDGVLIKDNHIKAAGGISEAVKRVRGYVGHTVKIEVETENLDQVNEALEAKAEIIMLDNMSVELMSKAVEIISGRALIEASGGINLDNLQNVAKTGVDLISIGWLTHSAPSLDLSLNIIDTNK